MGIVSVYAYLEGESLRVGKMRVILMQCRRNGNKLSR